MSKIFLSEISSESTDSILSLEAQFTNKKHLGLDAKLEIIRAVRVDDSDPIDYELHIYKKDFVVTSNSLTFKVPRVKLNEASYQGHRIKIQYEAVITVNDGYIFDTKETVTLQSSSKIDIPKEKAARALKDLEPKDKYSSLKNIAQISFLNKLLFTFSLVVVICSAALCFSLFYTMLSGAELYGLEAYKDQAPFTLFILVVVAIIFWIVKTMVFKSYIKIKKTMSVQTVDPDRDYKLSDFIKSKVKSRLTNLEVRLVAGVLECGQYERGSGTDRRTISFSDPVSSVVLLNKRIPSVPRRGGIEDFCIDSIDFRPIFEKLIPETMLSSSHGLALTLEFQIISPDLMDIELNLGTSMLKNSHFKDFI